MHIDFSALSDDTKKVKRFKPSLVMWWVGVGIVVVIALGGAVVYSGFRMVAEARDGRDALVAAHQSVLKLDFASSAQSARIATAHFRSAQRAGIPLAPFVLVPGIGTEIRAGRTLVTSALASAEAFESVVSLADEVLYTLVTAGGLSSQAPTLRDGEIAFFRLPPAERRALLAKLVTAPERLTRAVANIDVALNGFAQIPQTAVFHEINAVLAPVIEQLTSFRTTLVEGARLAELLPVLAGYPEPRRYLILLQNNTELRPTGGFIGTLGIVTIKDGEAVELSAQDVYDIDGKAPRTFNTVPPTPLIQYLGVTKWFLRDANWSPDFPTSARKAVELYSAEAGSADFDGVIAIDPTVGEELLRVVGNIRIGGSTFTPTNLTDEIEYQVEKGFDAKGLPTAQRKDILVALVNEVFTRVSALPPEKWNLVIDALAAGLEQKHILIASFDDAVAKSARLKNWDGALVSAQGDRLMVVDANLAALKTDSAMERSIQYAVRPDAGDYLATATIRYTNHGRFSWKTTRYRSYTRLEVPLGSELMSSSGTLANDKLSNPKRLPGVVDTVDELGVRSFGAFISVEPGETRELSFTYRLPEKVVNDIANGTYTLYVQKQAGLIAVPLTLDLNFGKNLTNATPPEEPKDWGDTRYRANTNLKTDREFIVSF